MTEDTKPEIKEVAQPETKPGGYKVEAISLIGSDFSRIASYEVQSPAIQNEINIIPEMLEISEENKFGVTLMLDYIGKQDQTIICTAKIKMLAIFEKIGEPALTEDYFKKVNAPAIIYPFIREHLHSLCLKAGLANIFLPTVNFKV